MYDVNTYGDGVVSLSVILVHGNRGGHLACKISIEYVSIRDGQ